MGLIDLPEEINWPDAARRSVEHGGNRLDNQSVDWKQGVIHLSQWSPHKSLIPLG